MMPRQMPLRLAARPKLRAFRVAIVMPDRSQGEHVGLYGHSFDAWARAADLFPEACRISVRRVSPRVAPTVSARRSA